MKLSQLIKQLQQLNEELGDVNVGIEDWADGTPMAIADVDSDGVKVVIGVEVDRQE